VNWSKYAPHPSIVVIIGDVDSGKTVTGACLIDDYHELGINCCIAAPRRIASKYPKWVHYVDPDRFNIPNNSACLVDDAHLYLYYRDWALAEERDKRRNLSFQVREHRHQRKTIIYTTQQGKALDTIGYDLVQCIIIKRPSLLQKHRERPELQETIERAETELPKNDKRFAYVISGSYEGLVGPYDPPEWWTQDISTSYQMENWAKPQLETKVIGSIIRQSIEAIKRLPI